MPVHKWKVKMPEEKPTISQLRQLNEQKVFITHQTTIKRG